MKITETDITFGGQKLTLTQQRAIHWEAEQTLILSDLHLGKAAHFRKHGISLPSTISMQDLSRLQQLLVHYHPRMVIIVGDLIHAGTNNEVNALADLTAGFPHTQFILIKGNHDRPKASYLAEIGIHTILDKFQLGGLDFVHHPTFGNTPTISGHIHPGVRIRLPHKKYLRFPCYAVMENQLILPAFSMFTGLDSSSLPRKTTYYAIHEEGLFRVAMP